MLSDKSPYMYLSYLHALMCAQKMNGRCNQINRNESQVGPGPGTNLRYAGKEDT